MDPCCQSCGVTLSEHLGLFGTCAELQALRRSHALLLEACKAYYYGRKPERECEAMMRDAILAAEPAAVRRLSSDPKYANWPPTLVPDAEE